MYRHFKSTFRPFLASLLAIGMALFMLPASSHSPSLLGASVDLPTLGNQAFTKMKQQYNVHPSLIVDNYVQCITDEIIAQVPSSLYSGSWEVVVFDEPQINAFALPGGKIGVFTGLLNVAKNQDQLATVIAHEIAHVIEEHSEERLTQNNLLGLGQQAASILLRTNNVSNAGPIMTALGLGAQYGVALPYSRAHETEADLLGLELMARAGFDPEESIELWHNMERAGGNRPIEFLSSHPAPATRIDNLKANMADANAFYNGVAIKPSCD